MAFIAFLGCDGSGKSTIIEKVEKELSRKGIVIVRGHWRPSMGGRGTARVPQEQIENPQDQEARGSLASVAKLAWIWANWWAGWFGSLRGASRNGHVIFDRYHEDLLVDPVRYRYGGPGWLARLATSLMPRPDLVFYLDAPVDVLLSRKQEVDGEILAGLRERYLGICRKNSRCVVIDADQSVMAITEAVLRRISQLSG